MASSAPPVRLSPLAGRSAPPPDETTAAFEAAPEPPPATPPPPPPLRSIGFLDLLEADPRPAFVVSLASTATTAATTTATTTPSVVYCNPALRASASILGDPANTAEAAAHAVYAAVAGEHHSQHGTGGPVPAAEHRGFTWTRTLLPCHQYVVVSANQPAGPAAAAETPAPAETAETPAAPAAAHVPVPPADATAVDTPAVIAPTVVAPTVVAPTVDTHEPPADEPVDTAFFDQFHALTDFMPVGMCVFDPASRVSAANRAWYHIMGCQPPDAAAAARGGGVVMTHAVFLAYIEDEDQAAVLRFFEQANRAAAHEPAATFGFRIKKYAHAAGPDASDSAPASSRDSHVLATAFAEKDASGRLVRTLVCLRDITEHRHIVEAADRHAQQASNLRRMAEFATVGMYELDVKGRLRGANRVFYEMCGLEPQAQPCSQDGQAGESGPPGQNEGAPHIAGAPKATETIDRPWVRCVADEDQPLVQSCLGRVLAGHSGGGDGDHETVEVRLKTPWTTDDGAGGRIVAARWVEASFLPVKDADGRVQLVTGCLSDISLRRWQLERERQVKEEAIESKRQQENFVDITSHEIRNPLTVIMHCGDAVLECLTRLHDGLAALDGVSETDAAETAARARAMVEDGIEYAEIIVSSALHQKAIVDDILTMSKLDADLLAVTPVTVDPIEIVRSTLKMFEVQARQQHIQLRMDVAPSYRAALAASPFLVLDPSRVKQILINLLTNALKFTQAVDVREVVTTVGVSHVRPTDAICAVSFVPLPSGHKLAPAYAAAAQPPSGAPLSTASSPSPPSSSSSPAPGSSLFLVFEVRDTGEGLTKEGVDSLFQKFVQADSNTHVKHGGSGLGLFISKRLAEIQNGAIGVASQPGVGSTFVFYIEAYVPPATAVPDVLSPGEAAKRALATGLRRAPGGRRASPAVGGLDDGSAADSVGNGTDNNAASNEIAPHEAPEAADNGAGSTSQTLTTDTAAAAAETTPTVSTPITETASPTSPTMLTSPTSPTAGSLLSPAAHGERLVRSTSAGGGGGSPGTAVAAARPVSAPALALQPSLSPPHGGSGDDQLASVPATPPEIRGVLLVEDNIVNQKVTRRYFEKVGFRVEVAANGLEAMAKIQGSNRCVAGSYPISVVLMDMEMPVQDGLTCTRHIRALEAAGAFAGGRMPVLMITGNARPEQIADARAAGCDDVVVKPFQMQLLFEHIQTVMHELWEADVRALAEPAAAPAAALTGPKPADGGNEAENASAAALPVDEDAAAALGGGDGKPCEPLDEGVDLARQHSLGK